MEDLPTFRVFRPVRAAKVEAITGGSPRFRIYLRGEPTEAGRAVLHVRDVDASILNGSYPNVGDYLLIQEDGRHSFMNARDFESLFKSAPE